MLPSGCCYWNPAVAQGCFYCLWRGGAVHTALNPQFIWEWIGKNKCKTLFGSVLKFLEFYTEMSTGNENSSPEQSLLGKLRAGESRSSWGTSFPGSSECEGIVTSGVCSINHRDIAMNLPFHWTFLLKMKLLGAAVTGTTFPGFAGLGTWAFPKTPTRTFFRAQPPAKKPENKSILKPVLK